MKSLVNDLRRAMAWLVRRDVRAWLTSDKDSAECVELCRLANATRVLGCVPHETRLLVEYLGTWRDYIRYWKTLEGEDAQVVKQEIITTLTALVALAEDAAEVAEQKRLTQIAADAAAEAASVAAERPLVGPMVATTVF